MCTRLRFSADAFVAWVCMQRIHFTVLHVKRTKKASAAPPLGSRVSRRFAFYNGEASEIGGRRAASPSGTRCETELDSRAPSARSTRVFPPQNSTISVTRLQSVNNCVLPWEILRRPPHQCMCLLRAAFPNRRTACELQRITPTRATGATWSDFLASRRDQKPMHHNAHDDKT